MVKAYGISNSTQYSKANIDVIKQKCYTLKNDFSSGAQVEGNIAP